MKKKQTRTLSDLDTRKYDLPMSRCRCFRFLLVPGLPGHGPLQNPPKQGRGCQQLEDNIHRNPKLNHIPI